MASTWEDRFAWDIGGDTFSYYIELFLLYKIIGAQFCNIKYIPFSLAKTTVIQIHTNICL